MIDYTKLPERFRPPIQRYIEHGAPPGSFLSAVIKNDLMDALGRADPNSEKELKGLVRWFYNEAPGSCWGSTMKFWKWIETSGRKGNKEVRT